MLLVGREGHELADASATETRLGVPEVVDSGEGDDREGAFLPAQANLFVHNVVCPVLVQLYERKSVDEEHQNGLEVHVHRLEVSVVRLHLIDLYEA